MFETRPLGFRANPTPGSRLRVPHLVVAHRFIFILSIADFRYHVGAFCAVGICLTPSHRVVDPTRRCRKTVCSEIVNVWCARLAQYQVKLGFSEKGELRPVSDANGQ